MLDGEGNDATSSVSQVATDGTVTRGFVGCPVSPVPAVHTGSRPSSFTPLSLTVNRRRPLLAFEGEESNVRTGSAIERRYRATNFAATSVSSFLRVQALLGTYVLASRGKVMTSLELVT